MTKILITGFEPFGGYLENSSWAVAKRVAASGVFNGEVVVEQLPVSYMRVAQTLREVVCRHNPDVLIMLGQSALSDRVKLERVALNLMDASSSDNDGYAPDEQPIDRSCDAALFTNLPIKRLLAAVKERNIAAKISNSCGLYVCNRTYFEGLRLCREELAKGAIFIHIPLFEGQASPNANARTMPLDDMAMAVVAIINEITKL